MLARRFSHPLGEMSGRVGGWQPVGYKPPRRTDPFFWRSKAPPSPAPWGSTIGGPFLKGGCLSAPLPRECGAEGCRKMGGGPPVQPTGLKQHASKCSRNRLSIGFCHTCDFKDETSNCPCKNCETPKSGCLGYAIQAGRFVVALLGLVVQGTPPGLPAFTVGEGCFPWHPQCPSISPFLQGNAALGSWAAVKL